MSEKYIGIKPALDDLKRGTDHFLQRAPYWSPEDAERIGDIALRHAAAASKLDQESLAESSLQRAGFFFDLARKKREFLERTREVPR